MPVYRQKHYDMIADAVKKAKHKAADEARMALDTGLKPHDVRLLEKAAELGVATVQYELMQMFKLDRETFKSLTFIDSCGTGSQDATPPLA